MHKIQQHPSVINLKKQIDLIISKTANYENDCNITLTDDDYWVLEMPGILVTIVTPEKDHEVNSNPLLAAKNSNNRPIRDLKDDIDMTSHLTFIQNRITNNENKLINSINYLLCESMRNRISESIQTARSNEWLAAKQLGFPTCTRLIPVGQTALLETCTANQMTISTEITICGPQVKVGENLTVSVNGFEIAKVAKCYHKNNLVNLNGFPYTYQDGDWKRIDETIVPIDQGFIHKIAYNADNSLETFLHMDINKVNMLDQMSVLADIIAVINEHEIDSATGNSHASSALIRSHEKENHSLLQNFARWLSYFGGISIATVAGLIVFKLCGGQAMIRRIFNCLGLTSWATNILSGNLLDLCKHNDAEKTTGTSDLSKDINPDQPSTIIEINPPLMDDDSLERQRKRSRSHSNKNRNPRRKSSSKRKNRNSIEP